MTSLPRSPLDAAGLRLGSDAPSQAPLGLESHLAPKALYQQVAERLREQIFQGELAPGSWIDELKVAANYGISRTPLREALKVLAVEGLVTMKVRRGAYVTDVSAEDVRQVYRLLGLLESDAAAWVAENASAFDLQRLSGLHQELEASVAQRETFFRMNEQFHLALLEIEGNRWRQQIVADLRKVMKLNRHHSLFKAGRLEESLAEHRDLMHALVHRQAEAARTCMSRHFQQGLAATQASPQASVNSQAAANRR